MKLFKQAVEKKHVKALCALGKMYRDGFRFISALAAYLCPDSKPALFQRHGVHSRPAPTTQNTALLVRAPDAMPHWTLPLVHT